MSDRQKLVDLTGWVGNVSTSVLIVFVNKLLMRTIGGYGFHYGERLKRVIPRHHPVSRRSPPSISQALQTLLTRSPPSNFFHCSYDIDSNSFYCVLGQHLVDAGPGIHEAHKHATEWCVTIRRQC